MTYKYISAILIGGLLAVSGCSKYTDVKTQGSLIPGNLDNYRLILNSSYEFETGGALTDYASADVEIIDAAQQTSLSNGSYYLWVKNAYIWNNPIYPLATDRDEDWDAYYGRIFNCNVILDEVPKSTGGTDSAKAEIMAEALVHRADAYIDLMSAYAKPYNSATASTDLGVPLVITPSLNQSLKRPSVAAVYTQIEADLKKAVRSLPNAGNFTLIPDKPAAYSLLARMYLLMGDYTNARTYADSTLAIQNTLTDLSASGLPFRKNDPEIILSKVARTSAAYDPTIMRLSGDILSLFDKNDMRYQLFTADSAAAFVENYTGRFYFMERVNGENRNIGTSVPEMILIKAEALARAGDVNGAMDQVNLLRQKRFAAADYVAMTATDEKDALVKVIQERRREFMCRLLPWMDQRRLKDDPLFSKTYTRTWQGQTYTLEPSSNRYVLPIAQYVINLNPEIEQNP